MPAGDKLPLYEYRLSRGQISAGDGVTAPAKRLDARAEVDDAATVFGEEKD
jgi:hypothetical protein